MGGLLSERLADDVKRAGERLSTGSVGGPVLGARAKRGGEKKTALVLH